jgi:hypothetical protein
MEIVIKSYTVVEESNVSFVIDDINTVGSTFVSLSEVDNLEEFDRVTVKVEVTNASESGVVGGDKKKQEVTVGDKSGYARVTLWELDIGKVGFFLPAK